MKIRDIPRRRLELAGEIVLGLLAWYWIAVAYPLQDIFPVYAGY